MLARIVALLAFLVPCLAHAATPEAVASATSAMMAACREAGGKPSLSAGYETAVDLNGDGQADYILDSNHLKCGGAVLPFCGASGGCLSEIFVSGPAGYRRAFSDNVYGFTIDRSARLPALRVSWHGFHCNRTGAEGCNQTLVWNGREFVAASGPARPPAPARTVPSEPRSNWALRRTGAATTIAFVTGQGPLRELSFICYRGQPYAAVIFRQSQSFDVGTMTATLAGRQVTFALQRQPDYPLTYAGAVGTTDLPRLVARASGDIVLALNGAPLATLPLDAAAATVRTALEPCFRF